AGVGVERDNRSGVKVVAFARRTVVIRTGIAGAPVGQVQLRIVGARHPDRSAASLPRLLIGAAPGGVARVVGSRSGVEAPHLLAGVDVVGVDEAADAVLGAGDAGDHLVLHHQRRGRAAVAAAVGYPRPGPLAR